MTRRLALHALIGFTSGALAVATIGLGYIIRDWQHAAKNARRTAHAYGRTTK